MKILHILCILGLCLSSSLLSEDNEDLMYIFTPGSEPHTQITNEQLVETFFDAFEKNQVDILESTLHHRYQVKTIGDLHQTASAQFELGSPDLKKRMHAYHSALPNLSIKIEQLVASKDKVVAQVSMTGIQKGVFFGIAPTNRYITIYGVYIFTLSSEKIIRIDEIMNEYNLMKQLGYIAI